MQSASCRRVLSPVSAANLVDQDDKRMTMIAPIMDMETMVMVID